MSAQEAAVEPDDRLDVRHGTRLNGLAAVLDPAGRIPKVRPLL